MDNDEFIECIDKIEEWMADTKKKKENTKFIVNGDFNLGFLKAWDPTEISDFLAKTKYRTENQLAIAKAKHQAIALLNFTEGMNLSQMVKESTRIVNILDLVLIDCTDEIEDITNVKHDKLSDHDTLIIELNISNKKEIDEPKKTSALLKSHFIT